MRKRATVPGVVPAARGGRPSAGARFGRAFRGLSLLAALSGCGATATPEPMTVDATPVASTPPSADPASLAASPFAVTPLWERTVDAASMPLLQGFARAPSGDVAIAVMGPTGVSIVVLTSTGRLRWEAMLHEAGDGYAHFGGMGFDVAGNLVVAGQFASRLEVSGKHLLDATDDAAYVLSLAAGGVVRWAKAIPGNGVAIPTLRVAARGESILLAGSFRRDVVLDGTTLPGGGAGDGVAGSLYLSRLDRGGVVQWARELRGNALVNDVLDDGAGHVVLAGDYFGAFAVEGLPELHAEGDHGRGSFLLVADAVGEPRWIRGIAARGVAAASDASLFFCAGPWERFGQKRLGSIRSGGDAGFEHDVGLLSCSGVEMAESGRLLVSGSVQLGEANPKTGGVHVAVRVLDVTRSGDVATGVTLPLPSAGSSAFALADSASGALVAGMFIEDHQQKLVVYRLSR